MFWRKTKDEIGVENHPLVIGKYFFAEYDPYVQLWGIWKIHNVANGNGSPAAVFWVRSKPNAIVLILAFDADEANTIADARIK